MLLLSSADVFQNKLLQKISFRNTIGVSNSFDPDQVQAVCKDHQQMTKFATCWQRVRASNIKSHKIMFLEKWISKSAFAVAGTSKKKWYVTMYQS